MEQHRRHRDADCRRQKEIRWCGATGYYQETGNRSERRRGRSQGQHGQRFRIDTACHDRPDCSRQCHECRDHRATARRRTTARAERHRTPTRGPQTRDGGHPPGHPSVAVCRRRSIDHEVAYAVAEAAPGYLTLRRQQQDFAVSNAALVQRHRLIQRAAAYSRHRPVFGDITALGCGSVADDIDDAWKDFTQRQSSWQGQIDRDRLAVAMRLHCHPTQVRNRHVSPRESP